MDQKEPLSRTAVIERRRSGAAVLPGKARHVLALCSRTAAAGVCILGLSLAGGQSAEASGQYGKAAIIGGLTSVGIGFVGSIIRGEQPTSGEIVKNAGVGAVGGVVGRTMNDRNWNGAIAGGVVAGVGNEIYRAQTRPKATGHYPQSSGQRVAPRYHAGTDERGVPVLQVPRGTPGGEQNFTQRSGGVSFAEAPKTGQAPGAAPDGSWNSRAVQEHNRAALAGYSGDLSTMTVMRDAVPVVIAQTEIGNFTVAHRSMHDAQRHQQQLERQAAQWRQQQL